MSEGRGPSFAIRAHNFGNPVIGWSPRVAGKTRSLVRDKPRRTSHAPRESGRMDLPVLVSASVAVRRVRSTSLHRKANTSPQRKPVNAMKPAAATAIGHNTSVAASSAVPNRLYSSSNRRRSLLRSAKSATPRTGLSARISLRTA